MTAPQRSHRPDGTNELAELLRERILVLDGAMGTMIQGRRLDEAAYRGERFLSHDGELAGDNDLLSLSNPDVIRSIHRAYLEAGADIICTNTFNGTRISQADYGLQEICYDLNVAAAALARETADEALFADRTRFVLADEQWSAFCAALDRPAEVKPELRDLFGRSRPE